MATLNISITGTGNFDTDAVEEQTRRFVRNLPKNLIAGAWMQGTTDDGEPFSVNVLVDPPEPIAEPEEG